MALQPEIAGKCYRKVKGKICGGNVIEHRVPSKRFNKIIGPGQNKVADFFIGRQRQLPKMIIGPGEFAGYVCAECGQSYATPPLDLDPRLKKLIRKKLKRILELNKKAKI